MSASANASAQNHGYAFQNDRENIDKKEFESDTKVKNKNGDDIKIEDIIVDGISVLKNDAKTSENVYRDQFKKILVDEYDHLVTILPHEQNNKDTYKESTMSNLLPAMYELTTKAFGDSNGDSLSTQPAKKVQKVEHSLLITNSSKPDLVVVQKNSTTIRIGEFKNASNYSKSDGANQCFLHLSCMLYFYRAVCHIPLNSVYGFSFCGPQCNALKDHYVIGLFKLSVPERLGEKFTLQQCWQKFNQGSHEGMQFLLYHLMNGKAWDFPLDRPLKSLEVKVPAEMKMPMEMKMPVEIKMPAEIKLTAETQLPALFNLPSEYWIDTGPSALNSYALRELQRNGTSAIVFKVNYQGLVDLLSTFKNEDKSKNLKRFVNSVKGKAKKVQIGITKDETGNVIERPGIFFYVKLRVVDTTPLFDKMTKHVMQMYDYAWENSQTDGATVLEDSQTDGITASEKTDGTIMPIGQPPEQFDVWNDIRNLYILKPYTDDDFLCIVMADVGGQAILSAKETIGAQVMIQLLRVLRLYMNQMIKMDIFHGDFLPHNLFYDKEEDRIKVIDFDEASFTKPGSVPLRVENDIGKEMYRNFFLLKYPNVLRNKCELYTKVQFAACVLQLLGLYKESELVEKQNAFDVAARELVNSLDKKSVESKTETFDKEEISLTVLPCIDRLYTCMDDLLNIQLK